MPRYQAVVFDMDGTILDTLEDLHLSLNVALASQGLPPRTREETRQTVGNGLRNLMRWSCPPGTPDAVVDAVFDAFHDHYALHCNDHTRPYPGIVEMVGRLREAGMACAVVSNKGDFAVQELARIHFPGVFDAVLGQRDDIPRKPDRAMCDLALARMGVGPARACYVGDSEVDVTCAANAELPILLVTWGFRDRDQLLATGATDLVDTVASLEARLLA